jgi:microcystin-dependent protein
MADPYIGEIRIFAGNFAPANWAFCNGQLLSIAQNTALFSILGTTYGGDGQATFGVPDLRGRGPVHQGQGPGLTNRVIGELEGTEAVTLITLQMPVHNHSAAVTVNSSARADTSSPAGAVFADTSGLSNDYAAAPDGSTVMNTGMEVLTDGIAGGSLPHENIQPYLCINFIIALQGIFPARN